MVAFLLKKKYYLHELHVVYPVITISISYFHKLCYLLFCLSSVHIFFVKVDEFLLGYLSVLICIIFLENFNQIIFLFLCGHHVDNINNNPIVQFLLYPKILHILLTFLEFLLIDNGRGLIFHDPFVMKTLLS